MYLSLVVEKYQSSRSPWLAAWHCSLRRQTYCWVTVGDAIEALIVVHRCPREG